MFMFQRNYMAKSKKNRKEIRKIQKELRLQMQKRNAELTKIVTKKYSNILHNHGNRKKILGGAPKGQAQVKENKGAQKD